MPSRNGGRTSQSSPSRAGSSNRRGSSRVGRFRGDS
jgi:hypothetical protein